MYKLASVKLWLFVLVSAAATVALFLGKLSGTEWVAALGWAYGVYCVANVKSKDCLPPEKI
jgi:hypothetical protein